MPPEEGSDAGSAEPPADPPPPHDTHEHEEKEPSLSGVVDSPELEAPLAGAIVTVVGKNKTTTTDDVGNYALDLPPGTYDLEVSLAGFTTVKRTVKITAGETLASDFSLATEVVDESSPTEVVVVVGSRTARSSLETTAPVDVITEADIQHSGRVETGRIIAALAPSFNATPQTIADGTDHVDPASLRGLGPDQVLVLVNGKRRHKSALLHLNGTFGRGTVGTDFNAIPLSEIKRIEILRDGAASQYGSDAIAGVINIVTKDAVDKLEMSALTGVTGKGDGATTEVGANYGFKLPNDGFVNLTGEFLSRGATNRSGTYTGTIYSANATTADDNATLASHGLDRDDVGMKIGEAAATAGMGGFNLELPTKDNAKFYAFGDLSYRNGRAGGFYRFPKQTTQNVPDFYPDGFLPEIHTIIADSAITAGWKRTGDTDVDMSITHGRNSFQFNIENSVNASLGTASPTTFDAGRLSFEQTLANLDLLRKVKTDAVKAFSLVAGSEFRVENYQIKAGDEASYVNANAPLPATQNAAGAQVFPGFQPSNEVNRTRNSVGVYAGIESELNKRLTVDLGGRFEQYSDFGNSLIGKLSTRLALTDAISLRGAVSTGFRAPSLQQLWFSNIATQFLPDAMGNLQPTQVLTSNNESPVTKAFGIPTLKEENSRNASGGFVIHPSENFAFTADAYWITIDNRIVLTSTFANTNAVVADILAPFPGVSQAQFFANAIDTSTVGADLVADYNIDLKESGSLLLTASANFTRTTVTDVNIPNSLRNKFAGEDPRTLKTFYFGRLAENRIEDSTPHQRANLAGRYENGRFAGLVRASYYGRVLYKPDAPANDEKFAPKVIFDLALDFGITKSLKLTLGADNVLNTFSDKQKKTANISDGRFVYSRNVSQFGQNGGFYYTKLEVAW